MKNRKTDKARMAEAESKREKRRVEKTDDR